MYSYNCELHCMGTTFLHVKWLKKISYSLHTAYKYDFFFLMISFLRAFHEQAAARYTASSDWPVSRVSATVCRQGIGGLCLQWKKDVFCQAKFEQKRATELSVKFLWVQSQLHGRGYIIGIEY